MISKITNFTLYLGKRSNLTCAYFFLEIPTRKDSKTNVHLHSRKLTWLAGKYPFSIHNIQKVLDSIAMLVYQRVRIFSHRFLSGFADLSAVLFLLVTGWSSWVSGLHPADVWLVKKSLGVCVFSKRKIWIKGLSSIAWKPRQTPLKSQRFICCWGKRITDHKMIQNGGTYLQEKCWVKWYSSYESCITSSYILLMEEILLHLGCRKPYEYWDIYYINWWSPDFFHQQYVFPSPLQTLRHQFFPNLPPNRESSRNET